MPPKGYKVSEETKAKLRAARERQMADPVQKARYEAALNSPETRAKRSKSLSEVQKGKTLSDEHKQKVRDSILALWQTDEHREKVLAGMEASDWREKVFTPERNQKISKARKKYFAELDPVVKDARLKKLSEASQQALRGRKRPNFPSEETKERIRQGVKRQWAKMTPCERAEIMTARQEKFFSERPATSIEIAVARVLDELNIAYIPEKSYGPYFLDFYLPDFNIALECDGDYWHGPLRPEQQAHDLKRDAWLQKRGLVVIRLTETAIRKDVRALVISALQQWRE